MSDRIATPSTAQSTADEVSEGVDLAGKRAIVTGGASGIGVETAKTLARRGAAVTLAVRNLDAGGKVAAEITAETGNTNIDVRPLELTDLASVRRFVAGWDEPLHLLINNAGVMAIQERTVNDAGWEAQLAASEAGTTLSWRERRCRCPARPDEQTSRPRAPAGQAGAPGCRAGAVGQVAAPCTGRRRPARRRPARRSHRALP